MSAHLPTTSATCSQRALIKQLLKQAQYDRGTVTRKYLRIGASEAWVGRASEHWLDSLRFPEAQRAIAQLQKDAAHAPLGAGK